MGGCGQSNHRPYMTTRNLIKKSVCRVVLRCSKRTVPDQATAALWNDSWNLLHLHTHIYIHTRLIGRHGGLAWDGWVIMCINVFLAQFFNYFHFRKFKNLSHLKLSWAMGHCAPSYNISDGILFSTRTVHVPVAIWSLSIQPASFIDHFEEYSTLALRVGRLFLCKTNIICFSKLVFKETNIFLVVMFGSHARIFS